MYTSPSFRAAQAYKRVGAESGVDGASAHQLIVLLFDALQQSLNQARGALDRGDVAIKGASIQRAVRILEEGLKAGLDPVRGGDLAQRLRALYDYCIERLTVANLRNDAPALNEVAALVAPVAQGWKDIGSAVAAQPH